MLAANLKQAYSTFCNEVKRDWSSPDFIFCRTQNEISQEIREKLALFCNVKPEHVIENKDVSSIYEVPFFLKIKILLK